MRSQTTLELLELGFDGKKTKGKYRPGCRSTSLCLSSLLPDDIVPKGNLFFKKGKSRVNPR